MKRGTLNASPPQTDLLTSCSNSEQGPESGSPVSQVRSANGGFLLPLLFPKSLSLDIWFSLQNGAAPVHDALLAAE